MFKKRVILSITFLFLIVGNTFAAIQLKDENVSKGYITILDITGSGGAASRSGRTGTINLPNNGDVTGPSSSTDNAIPRYDGTGGKTLQNSGVTIDDNDKLIVPGDSDLDGAVTINESGADKDFRIESLNEPNLFRIDASEDEAIFGKDNSTITPLMVNRGLKVIRNGDVVGGASISYSRSRGTLASPTNLLEGDAVGIFNFLPYNGAGASGYDINAKFNAYIDGTPSGTTMPTALSFETGTSNADNDDRKKVLEITSDHNVCICEDNFELRFGTGEDTKETYNDTDWIHKPDVVGTGAFVITTGTTQGKQAFVIDQNDADQPFIDYQGTSSADLNNNISTFTTEGGTIKYFKIELNGVAAWIRTSSAPTS